jgi:hypothetical protein
MKCFLKLIFFLVFLTSCFKEVDYEIPLIKPKLVLSSFFTANENIIVTVTQTQSSKDTLYNISKEIGVWINGNGQEYELQRLNENTFRTTFKPIENCKYMVKVQVDGFETITSEDSIPDAVNFEIDRYIPFVYVDNEGYSYSAFQITINDIPKERTYFELRMKEELLVGNKTTINFSDINSSDLIVRNEGIVNQLFDKISLLFTNELINTSSRKLSVVFNNEIKDDYVKILRAEIQLRTVSKDYFDYKKKLYLNINNQSGDFWDSSGSSVEAFTNVKNGYGIFAGYSQSSKIYTFN